jgi:hypothetical protein
MSVNRYLTLASDASLDTTCVEDLVTSLATKMASAEAVHPKWLSNPRLRRILSARALSIEGSREELIARASQLVVPAPCESQTIAGVEQSNEVFCRLDFDCLGLTCALQLRSMYLLEDTTFRVRLAPCYDNVFVSLDSATVAVDISTLNTQRSITLENVLMLEPGSEAHACKQDPYVDILVEFDDQLQTLSASITVDVRKCTPSMECTSPRRVLESFRLYMDYSGAHATCGGERGTITDPAAQSIASIAAAIKEESLDDLQDLSAEFEIRDACLREALLDFRVALAQFAIAQLLPGSSAAAAEFPLEEFDVCLSGVIQFPTLQVTFFNLPLGPFIIGPVVLTVDIGAGGAVGASLKITACVLSMKLTAELVPWGAVDIYGALSAQILMFLVQVRNGARLDILKVSFSVVLTVPSDCHYLQRLSFTHTPPPFFFLFRLS